MKTTKDGKRILGKMALLLDMMMDIMLETEQLVLAEEDQSPKAKKHKGNKLMDSILDSIIEECADDDDDDDTPSIRRQSKIRKSCSAVHDMEKNTLTLNAPEQEFDKGFLKYMLESMGLPANTKIIFNPQKEKESRNEN